MPTAHLNGIDIYYEEHGEGPNLLFFNGSGSTLAEAGMMVQVYAGAGLHVAAHDQRGLGKTSIPPGPYTMADYAADGIALADHLGWDTFRAVGTSFGGMVAQEVAVTVPERVERLALLCTSSGGAGQPSYPLHELRDLPPAEAQAVAMKLMDTRFDATWLAEHPSDRALVEMMANRSKAERGSERERGEIEQMEARRGHDVWDRLPRITCPTLVASGRYDGIAPASNGEAIASQIPAAELRVYEGGHAFFGQDPQAFPDILAFLTT
jgi:pimeloyl-ACP methyl ester carboxylesterase